MDVVVHGENISSQSANILSVSKILSNKKRGTAEITISDGSSFVINEEIIRMYQLYEGMEIDSDTIENLKKENEVLAVKEKALDIVSRSEQSGYMLKNKLIKKGFDKQAISIILSQFYKNGIIDDRRFAEMWISARVKRKREGRIKLLAELSARGISRDIADAVLQEALPPEMEQNKLKEAYSDLKRKHGENYEKIYSALQRKGFSPANIMRLVNYTED